MAESKDNLEANESAAPRRGRPTPQVDPQAAAGGAPAGPKPPRGPRKMRPMPVPQPHPQDDAEMMLPPGSALESTSVVAGKPRGGDPEPQAGQDVVPVSGPEQQDDSEETSIMTTAIVPGKPASAASIEPSNSEKEDLSSSTAGRKPSRRARGGADGGAAKPPAEPSEEAGEVSVNAGTGWGLDLDAAAEGHGDDQGVGYGYGDGEAPLSASMPLDTPGAPKRLSISSILSYATLRAAQDTFWSTARHPAFIVDADGRPVLGNSHFVLDVKANLVLNHLMDPGTQAGNGPVMFPIMADGQQVGAVALDLRHLPIPLHVYRQKFARYAASLGIKKASDVASLVHAAERVFAPNAGAAAYMAIQMASQLSRLCEQEIALRERIEELGTLGHMTTLLAGERDLNHRLNAAVRSAAAVLNVKAAGIRLLDETSRTLRVTAAYNLSRDFINNVVLEADNSPIVHAAFSGETVFIEDLSTDERVVYQTRAVEEGLVSTMVVGLIYRNRPLGTFHVYTGERRQFSRSEAKLFSSIAKLTASAVENWRRDAEVAENQRVQRQLKLATDVQRRMLPRTNPNLPGFEIDARYVPSFEIGGDFYDFISLGPNMGIAVGDVAGKGIAAGLLMASVRASLRAYAQDHYDIDQVMSRVNRSLAGDTLASEFATVFFGVLDPASRRLTYCNAGHEPPLLLRDGEVSRLEVGGMVVGIDPEQVYKRGLAHLRPGDLLLFYTDGLPDAQNFDRKRFGKDRVVEAFHECANLSAKAAVNHLLWQMRRFVGMNHPTDDTTIVVIRVTG